MYSAMAFEEQKVVHTNSNNLERSIPLAANSDGLRHMNVPQPFSFET